TETLPSHRTPRQRAGFPSPQTLWPTFSTLPVLLTVENSVHPSPSFSTPLTSDEDTDTYWYPLWQKKKLTHHIGVCPFRSVPEGTRYYCRMSMGPPSRGQIVRAKMKSHRHRYVVAVCNLFRPLLHLIRVVLDPFGRRLFRRFSFLDQEHDFFHILGRPIKAVHDLIGLRVIFLKPFPHEGVDIFRLSVGFLRILQEFQLHLGKFPMGLPSGYRNRL